MSIKFKSRLSHDTDEEAKRSHTNRSRPSYDLDFASSKSVVMKKQTQQKDILFANKIAKNDFFAYEDPIFGDSNNDKIQIDLSKTQTSQNKNAATKRKKVSTSIKLQPLKTLQLKKNVQKIEFVQLPPSQMMKRQSEAVPQMQNPNQEQQLEISKTLSSVYRSNLLNFEMNSSSSDEETDKKHGDLDEIDINLKKHDTHRNNTLFFEEEDQQIGENNQQQKKQEKKPQLKQLKFKRTLKKKSESLNDAKQTTINQTQNKEIKKSEPVIFNQENAHDQQNQNSQNEDNQAKVGIEAEPNPEQKPLEKTQNHQNQSFQSKPQVYSVQHEHGVNFQTMKRLILQSITKQSVLNLKLIRNKSILNFFSPEFRLQFFQDKYFVMGCKKTSSKPTSTFIFTCSEFNFEETSKKYMGKMKSNIAGSIYNIFGPGMNPSNAKSCNVVPRQLLATVIYKTELFGTGRPKEFCVYIKRPEYRYYGDFAGVKMYEEEIPLHELFSKYPENMGKVQILNTRKPTYFKETKEYVMNFEGKVKKSSIKNFIMEDRGNNNAKAMLFGKINEDEFVLDVLDPLTPIVGAGVALTMFDTRLGSD